MLCPRTRRILQRSAHTAVLNVRRVSHSYNRISENNFVFARVQTDVCLHLCVVRHRKALRHMYLINSAVNNNLKILSAVNNRLVIVNCDYIIAAIRNIHAEFGSACAVVKEAHTLFARERAAFDRFCPARIVRLVGTKAHFAALARSADVGKFNNRRMTCQLLIVTEIVLYKLDTPRGKGLCVELLVAE